MQHANQRVLVVDDQPEVIQLLIRQIGNEYDMAVASNGEEALRLVDDNGPFAAVVADYSMPDIDGVSLVTEIRSRSPDTVPIMLTAHAELDIAVEALHRGNIFRFLRKPWEKMELGRAVHDAVSHHALVNSERRLRLELEAANDALAAKVREVDETNQLLEYWVEFSPAVLYSAEYDAAGPRFTYVSKNFHRLCGRERTALIVDPDCWKKFIHPDDRQRYATELETFIRGRHSEVSIRYRVLDSHGAERTLQDTIRCIRDPRGRALELVGAWIDLSVQ